MARGRYQGETTSAERSRASLRRTVAIVALTLWFVIVVAYFLWEMASYQGLFALVSDVQFAALRRSFPLATAVVLILIFASPCLFLLREPRVPDEDIVEDSAVLSARRFGRQLMVFAAGFAIAALVALGMVLSLPAVGDTTGAGRPVTEATRETPAAARGSVRGDILFSRASTFATDAIVYRHEVRIVPIAAAGDRNQPLRYFAEFEPGEVPDTAADQRGAMRSGLIVAGHVPPALLALYRDAGYGIAEPSYLVVRSTAMLSAPYWSALVWLVLGAVVAGLLALFQFRHVRSLSTAQVRDNPAEPVELN